MLGVPIEFNTLTDRSAVTPGSLYDLHIACCDQQRTLANIGLEGFGSIRSTHSFRETSNWDPYSGDYGLNYIRHVLHSVTYSGTSDLWVGEYLLGYRIDRQ